SGLSLRKPEPAQSSKHLLAHCYRANRRWVGVLGPIGTQESKLRRRAPLDRKLPPVQRGVVPLAQRHEVLGVVPSAFCWRIQVMNVQEPPEAAARHHTATAIAV